MFPRTWIVSLPEMVEIVSSLRDHARPCFQNGVSDESLKALAEGIGSSGLRSFTLEGKDDRGYEWYRIYDFFALKVEGGWSVLYFVKYK